MEERRNEVRKGQKQAALVGNPLGLQGQVTRGPEEGEALGGECGQCSGLLPEAETTPVCFQTQACHSSAIHYLCHLQQITFHQEQSESYSDT